MSSKIDKDELRRFHNYLVQCKNIIVLIGSGLSASSGLETFQHSSGFWREFHSIDVSTPDAFLDNPGLVWQFYSWRRRKALKAKPNKGHYAIAELAARFNNNNRDHGKKKQCLTINQNVDGLNVRAGHDKRNLLELHGNLFSLKCTDFFCNYTESNNFEHPLTKALQVYDSDNESGNNDYDDDDGSDDQLKNNSHDHDKNNNKKRKKRKVGDSAKQEINLNLSKDELPRCPACGGLLRPGVIWFGESIPLRTIDRIDDFYLQNKVDLVLVVGTSGQMWPAVGYVERARLQGLKIAVFNTSINQAEIAKDKDHCWGFEGDAAETLPQALEPIIGRNYVPRDYRRR